jgi:hypothetical protein
MDGWQAGYNPTPLIFQVVGVATLTLLIPMSFTRELKVKV